MPTRRAFLGMMGAAVALRSGEHFAGPLGLEIYSLRRELKQDLPGTLAKVRQFGFDEVEVPEFYGLDPLDFRRALDRADLRATAMVAQDERLRKDMDSVVRDARTLGVSYVIYPWIPHDAFGREEVMRASDDMNAWGAKLKAAELTLCYHPHGYEFRPAPEGTLFDLMAANTAKRRVYFQLDVFWVAWPGHDPVRLMQRYPERINLMHIKELAKGFKTGDLTGSAPEESSGIVGQGVIDFPAVLREARRIGIKRYYLEDEAANAIGQIPRSLKYLNSLSF